MPHRSAETKTPPYVPGPPAPVQQFDPIAAQEMWMLEVTGDVPVNRTFQGATARTEALSAAAQAMRSIGAYRSGRITLYNRPLANPPSSFQG